jgi:integral membrane protein
MTHLKILKLLAVAEGISYLCFAITVPLKYALKIPEPNLIVGMLHGILFMAFCLWLVIYGIKSKQTFWYYAAGGVASLLPMGTFWFDKKYLTNSK